MTEPVSADQVTGGRGGAALNFVGRVTSGLVGTTAIQLLSLLVQLATTAAMARMLTPAEFGVMASAQIVIGLIVILAEVGIGTAIVQQPEMTGDRVRVAFTLSLLFSGLCAGALWASSGMISGIMRVPELADVIRVLSLIFVVQGGGIVAQGLLLRRMQTTEVMAIELASLFVGYSAVGLLLAGSGWSYWALVIGALVQAAVRTALLLHRARHPMRPMVVAAHARPLLSDGLGYSLARVIAYVGLYADNAVVGRYMSVAELGFYSRAYNLAMQPVSLYTKIADKVVFPAFARVQSDRAVLGKAVRQGLALTSLVAFPTSIALIILAPELVRVLLGPRWDAVVLPLQILAAVTPFRVAQKMFSSVIGAVGLGYQLAALQAVYSVLVLVGCFALRERGIDVIAAMVAAAIIVNFCILGVRSCLISNIGFAEFVACFVRPIALSLLTATCCCTAAVLLRRADIGPLAVLVGGGLGTALIMLVVIRCFPAATLGTSGADFVRRIGEAIRPRRRRAESQFHASVIGDGGT